MPQAKKDARNFGCKLDRVTFEHLEKFCAIPKQNKTLVVERAIQQYLDENMEMMREVAKNESKAIYIVFRRTKEYLISRSEGRFD